MLGGKMGGLFVMGPNPAVAGPNSGMERRGLGKLKWLVVREMVETETASFWYESPEVKRGELRTEEIPTEVFLLPAAESPPCAIRPRNPQATRNSGSAHVRTLVIRSS